MKPKSIFLAIIWMFYSSIIVQAAVQPSLPPIGAPLDGGMLAVLAAAGITYFTARKKKRNL